MYAVWARGTVTTPNVNGNDVLISIDFVFTRVHTADNFCMGNSSPIK